MQVSDFHYDLPPELIAQRPPEDRSAARMLVLSRAKQEFRDDAFRNFPNYVKPGDCLVLNNTRVLKARLHGRRNSETGAMVEVFLLTPRDERRETWDCLVRPAKRVRTGDSILFPSGLRGLVLQQADSAERVVKFEADGSIAQLLEQVGEIPLPPYIERPPEPADTERYQTVFAKHSGSVAAPTAGLHFTPEILERCRASGAKVSEVTLHVGLGTFAPLRAVKLEDVQLHRERCEISESAVEIMRAASRVFCVGTTSVRAVETAARDGKLRAFNGPTRLFISPGFVFQTTGAMLTNFHLPQSSLLMLVAAFAGYDLTMAAYRHAVKERYRFFSYGDCMLIE